MIQRLADIRTDATAAFEKESKMLIVRWDDELLLLALADKASGDWQAAEIIKFEEAIEPDFISELKQKSTLANYTGLQTQVFITTPQAMVIPTELEGGISLFLKTQFGIKEGAEVYTSEIGEKMTAGFLLQQDIQAIIKKLFPQAELKSSLGLLVKQALQEGADDTIILLQLGKTVAEVAVVQNGQLLVARCFSFTANEDVLYHLLNACRVFDFSPQTVKLILQGQVQEQDSIYQLFKKYFANLHFAETATVLQHTAFSQVPAHYFTPLMQPL